jgi:hypothetical protein
MMPSRLFVSVLREAGLYIGMPDFAFEICNFGLLEKDTQT